MAPYYVNNDAQTNGDHEVHHAQCSWLPQNRTYLGQHASCQSAVLAAKMFYPSADGCYHCSNECHKR